MKLPSFFLLCFAFAGGVVNAALLPPPETGDNKVLPGAKPPGKVLPGGGAGGKVLPGNSNSGGHVLPRPAVDAGGGDNFQDATRIRLVKSIGGDLSDNKRATLEPGEPFHGGYDGNPGGKSMWWKFEARVNGHMIITTAGSNFDTVLGVYTGENFSSLTTIAQDNDSGPNQTSRVSIRMLAGVVYYIAVDGYNGASGKIQLSLNGLPDPIATSGPLNDDYQNAIELSGSYAIDYGFNYGATIGPEDSDLLTFVSSATVWWTWTAPASGKVTVSTAGSDFNTALIAYNPQFSYFGGIFEGVYWNYDVDFPKDRTSRLTFEAREGEVYDFAVDGEFGGLGFIVLSVRLEPGLAMPTNDAFGFRKGISGRSYSEETSNAGTFLNEAEEPLHGGEPFAWRSLWWTWTAPSNGIVTFSAEAKPSTDPKKPNNFKPVVAAYRGPSLGLLKTIGSEVDTDRNGFAETSFAVKKGEIYQVAVASYESFGPFTFRLRYEDGSPSFSRQPQAVETTIGDTVTFTAEVSSKSTTPVKYQWQLRSARNQWVDLGNDSIYSGVRSPTLTVKNVTIEMDGYRFRCVIQNIHGVQTSKVATLTVGEAAAASLKKTKDDNKKDRKKSGKKVLRGSNPSGGKLLGG